MKISICIPTYNRAAYLINCLQSISKNQSTNYDFQVCISDNGSKDNTSLVVQDAQKKLKIKYHKNSENIGRVRNYLNVVDMADGEFVWLIGDDDLLLPDAILKISRLIDDHKNVDFFYVNSFHLTTEYVYSFPQPFDLANLPDNMELFSKWKKNGEIPFLDLVDPRISFDFLGGMFLAVFRRSNWIKHVHALDENAISDVREFSNFDNTFPHIKIFAEAFAKSTAYFQADPLSVCLTGAREWSPMYPLVRSVRLIEALNEYRKNGLSIFRYLYCKNFALSHFIEDLASMYKAKNDSGFIYIQPCKIIFTSCLFPNFYISFYYFFLRLVKFLIRKLKNSGHPTTKDMAG